MRKTSKVDSPNRLAVIEGNHPYEVPPFHELFRSMKDMDAYVQSIDTWLQDWGGYLTWYDAVLFYNMTMTLPAVPDGGKPPIETAIEKVAAAGKGLIVLHHAILAYPSSKAWSDMTGIGDRRFQYYVDQDLSVRFSDGTHPITKGLASWDVHDETYAMADAGAGSTILMTTEHPKSMRTIAWTRSYGKSRVFCFQCGHDHRAWEHPSFREILHRGILWAANRPA